MCVCVGGEGIIFLMLKKITTATKKHFNGNMVPKTKVIVLMKMYPYVTINQGRKIRHTSLNASIIFLSINAAKS